MTEQTRQEIFKSHIFGMSNQEIAECYGISKEAVDKLISESTAEIENKKAFMKQIGAIE